MGFQLRHAFIKGDTHTIGADYALSAPVPGLDLSVPFNPLVIVSDGCSAAPHSDVGARILTWAARKVFTELIARNAEMPSPASIGQEILTAVLHTKNHLQMDLYDCAATLVVAFVLAGHAHVYAYGDGCWYYRSRDGLLHYTMLEHSEEAPPYLIFAQDKYSGYLKRHPGGMRVTDHPSGASSIQKGTEFHWTFPVGQIVEIGVCSDGVMATDRTVRDVLSVLTGEQSLDYLMERFLRSSPMLNDDLAIASIVISES